MAGVMQLAARPGLGTIIEVLRFQAIRIREVALNHGHHG
jgi:hypothetical protein